MLLGREELISSILKGEKIDYFPINGFRNESYVAFQNNKKYIIKFFIKKDNWKREYFSLDFFKSFKSFNSPELLFLGENYIGTRFEEGLTEFSADEIPFLISEFHNEFQNKIPLNIKEKYLTEFFDREAHLKRFTEDYLILKENKFDVKKIEMAIASFPEKEYSFFPKIICHGDAHRKNLLKNSDKSPFFLDFEFSHLNYPTFDIATNIYSDPENLKKSIVGYLKTSRKGLMEKFEEDHIVNCILSDTVRICINDISKSIKKLTNKNLETRLNHDRKVLNKIFKVN